jgi:hypothetical protein
MNYIYMTEDNKRASRGLHGNKEVFLKIGYSKHPTIRGGQMRQASRRTLGFEIDTMKVKSHIFALMDDTPELALFVESFVIRQALHMNSASRLAKGKEFIKLSIADRERCYNALPLWVIEAQIEYLKIRGA